MEGAGPARVAEAVPGAEQLVERGGGEAGGVGPALQHRAPALQDPADRGLLEHHLAEEHSPGIAGVAPGEVVTPVGGIPGGEGVAPHPRDPIRASFWQTGRPVAAASPPAVRGVHGGRMHGAAHDHADPR